MWSSGLAIVDAVYYFSYERRLGKGATSGVLGGVWRLLTLPFYCLMCSRFVFRPRRKARRYPYVPRCLGSSEVSAFGTDLDHTSTTLPTDQTGLSTGPDHSGPQIDHNGLPRESNGSRVCHNGSTVADQSASIHQTSAETDLTILSSHDESDDSISVSSSIPAASATNNDCDDWQGHLPTTPQAMQLELETKEALRASADDLEDEFEKVDLSSN